MGSRLAALGLALAVSSCVGLQVPPDFLVVARDLGELKAVTADDARLWVREFPDPDRGDLAFWTRTLKNDLVKNRGYVLIGEAATKDAQGNPGTELLLETTVRGRPLRELLALFVYPGLLDGRIRVVELVAEPLAFDATVEGVRESIAAMEP